MVTINENATGVSVNVSYTQGITKQALNELKTKFGFNNPLNQLKISILDSISKEIDDALNGKFSFDKRQILND
jgi:ABC-type microcin C transport system permease subunit YejB